MGSTQKSQDSESGRLKSDYARSGQINGSDQATEAGAGRAACAGSHPVMTWQAEVQSLVWQVECFEDASCVWTLAGMKMLTCQLTWPDEPG